MGPYTSPIRPATTSPTGLPSCQSQVTTQPETSNREKTYWKMLEKLNDYELGMEQFGLAWKLMLYDNPTGHMGFPPGMGHEGRDVYLERIAKIRAQLKAKADAVGIPRAHQELDQDMANLVLEKKILDSERCVLERALYGESTAIAPLACEDSLRNSLPQVSILLAMNSTKSTPTLGWI